MIRAPLSQRFTPMSDDIENRALPAAQDRAVAASPSSPQAVSPVPASIPSAGPWLYRPDEHDDWGTVRASPDGEGRKAIICQARFPYADQDELAAHRYAGTDPWEGAARLIAAAPELLRACVAALATHNLTESDPNLPSLNEVEGLLRAAIAKATGV
jgi:hypothetical protein